VGRATVLKERREEAKKMGKERRRIRKTHWEKFEEK
jgi:hypothetical protein